MKKQEQTRSSTGSNDDRYAKVSQSQKKKFCLRQFYFSIYHILRFALGIAIIVLISQTNLQKIKKNTQYTRVQQIIALWGKNVIVDIITVSTFNCPQAYEPFSSATWIGTKEGCLCKASINSYDYIHVIPGQCTSKLISAGCTKINPQPSIPFLFWKPNLLICVKRLNGLNFYTNLTNFISPQSVKNCAAGSPFEFQTIEQADCPITSISNISSAYSNVLEQIGFSYANENNYPIIDLKMSQYQFCQEYNRSNISPNRFQNYVLQLTQIKNCDQANDPRVQQIDLQTQLSVYQNNQRVYDIVSNKLPAYPVPSQRYIYKLGTVSYPPWTYTCRTSLQFNLGNTYNMFVFADTVSKSQICMYLTILIIIVWSFIYSLVSASKRITEIKSRYNNKILFYSDEMIAQINPNLLNNAIKVSLPCELITFTFLCALGIALLVQIGVQYQYLSYINDWFRNSMGCMDGALYFQTWIQFGFIQPIQIANRKYLICILAALFLLAMDVVFLIWRFNRGDLASHKFNELFASSTQRNSDDIIYEINKEEFVIQQKQKVDAHEDIKIRKTNDYEMETIEPELGGKQKQRIIVEGKRFSKIQNRKNTMATTKAIKELNNPTEESLANFKQDDVDFNRITFQNSPPKNQKKRTSARPRQRILSLEFQD